MFIMSQNFTALNKTLLINHIYIKEKKKNEQFDKNRNLSKIGPKYLLI